MLYGAVLMSGNKLLCVFDALGGVEEGGEIFV
jgi:hypothetical protein